MTLTNKNITNLVADFAKLPEVEAILLAGSMSTATNDKDSDYDISIYLNDSLKVSKRKEVCAKYFKNIELNNTFWEMEDDGELFDGTPVELIYRDPVWLEGEMERIVTNCQAGTGYSTCLWHNLITSGLLFDRNNRWRVMKEKYDVTYPDKLQRNIIEKNYPLLKEQIPAYYHQIEKALKRDDFVSVNHRVSAFLESYFDIIFALNKRAHPGEKKLIKTASDFAILPDNFPLNLEHLLKSISKFDDTVLSAIDKIISELDKVLIGKF